MLETVFLILIGLVLYHLLGYPFLLLLLPKRRRYKFKKIGNKISLIIAAYNEEEFIEKKIRNSLELDYDNLEIIVVSDGSTDRTNEICKKYEGKIKFIEMPERHGKLGALNAAVPHSGGELLLFSDANTFYKSNAVKELAKHFSNPKVGCVTGKVKLIAKKGAHKEGESIYTKLESFIQYVHYAKVSLHPPKIIFYRGFCYRHANNQERIQGYL
jgi:cellulose synthase/poly-beta-1,6-N-acetylglucosamine synthase-like glycosyltransferase